MKSDKPLQKYKPQIEGHYKPLKQVMDIAMNSSYFHVLIQLWWRVGKNDSTYVGLETLCKKTGRSKPTVIEAIKFLEENGFITVKRRANATSIYRLNPNMFKWEKQLNDSTPKKVNNLTPKKSNNFTSEGLNNFTQKNKVKTKKKENQEIESCANTVAQNLEGAGESKISVGKVLMSVPNLWYIWKTRKQERYPDTKFVPDLTGKQAGQLKCFINKVAPIDAGNIIESLMKNWSGFYSWINCKHDLKHIPLEPQINFVLTYREDAVNFHLDSLKEKKLITVHPEKNYAKLNTPEPLHLPSPPGDPADDEYGVMTMASFEEFTAGTLI